MISEDLFIEGVIEDDILSSIIDNDHMIIMDKISQGWFISLVDQKKGDIL